MRLVSWFKQRFSHKIDHVRWSTIKSTFKEHGLALVVIIVGWEIIEDILFPVLFVYLGKHVHPAFYTLAPASWLLCLHWLVVPFTWGVWIKIKDNKSV